MTKRLIKKYPNRRLYDTQESRYITLEDIRRLVLQHVPITIIDAKTQEDLTNTVLLQVLSELEQKGAPIFTTVMLEQIIRLYGNEFQQVFSDFLEKNMLFFKEIPSARWLTKFNDQQNEWWQQWQKLWFNKQ